MSNKQLVVFACVVIVLTLALAWLIERRTVLSLRQELNTWGQAPDALPDNVVDLPTEKGDGGPVVGWPDDEAAE